ncbi:hypothetical protein, partial [Escherichia coli]|uniref:hypothetical protein n=1 Tax=Escherichia coli TaxID=562 RepID=UPI0020BDB423
VGRTMKSRSYHERYHVRRSHGRSDPGKRERFRSGRYLCIRVRRYAHHDETSLITVNITREDGLLRLKETEYDMAGSDYILFTAMRDTDSPERFDAPAVVSLSNQCISLRRNDISQTIQQSSPLWLTNQQSGCSVLIVRHGLSESGEQ